jgi:fructose-1,6-bisphosphatase/inositol monophosphatase family enzyme
MNDTRSQLAASEIEELHASALTFADTARAIIASAWRSGFSAERKRDGSFVTNVDLEVEDKLRTLITRRYPEHGILGEEFPPARPGALFQWILDPIDGTEDFVHRVPTFGSILALYYNGVPLVGVLDHPALELRCDAAYGRGTRKNGERMTLGPLPERTANAAVRAVLSARGNFIRYRDEGSTFDALTRAFPNHRIYRSCYGHSLVASGAVDAMVDYHDTPWDLAAAQITAEEAGGVYRVVRSFVVDGLPIYSAVFGKPEVVERLCAIVGTR